MQNQIAESAGLEIQAQDGQVLHEICGFPDSPISRIERECAVRIVVRGNTVKIFGPEGKQAEAAARLQPYLEGIKTGALPGSVTEGIASEHVPGPACAHPPAGKQESGSWKQEVIRTARRRLEARNPAQAAYINAMHSNDIVFGVGPAGTGKTYLAVAAAVERIEMGEASRMILTRPAVEAGERLGFLPGDLAEKVSPYLRPLYDALYDLLPPDRVEQMIRSRQIEVAPLAFMRGRTLSRAVVILDEGQNTTPVQMKMFLTRLGQGSKAIVTGDATQTDLPFGTTSGLLDAIQRLAGIEEAGVIHFSKRDVVRSTIVSRILAAYHDDD